MSQYTYVVTCFPDPDEDGHTPGEGRFYLSTPFDADTDQLKALALEHVGIYNEARQSVFTSETDESGGIIIRDGEGEPFLSIQLDDEADGELDFLQAPDFAWEG